MDIFSLSSTVHYSHTPPSFSTSTLAGKHHVANTSTSPASFILASNSSQDSAHDSTTSLRRPTSQKPLKASTSNSSQLRENPLKRFVNSQNVPPLSPVHHPVILSVISYGCPANSHLRPLLLPPPAPLLSHPLQETPQKNEVDDEVLENSEENEKEVEFREKGKIFVGNLPLWIKKKEWHTAETAAMKAVEFDGIEFHGRVLTVKLDNGKRMKGKHARGQGGWRANGRTGKTTSLSGMKRGKVHEGSFGGFWNLNQRVGRWLCKLLRGLRSLIHAYAVGRDMEEALSCVRKMRDEGIEMSLVTYSILVGGFAKIGNVE
ncbi:UNVERIFIED_CONTAM: Pentatricopeptide repeat-containing protein, chloroplastic [Sesamum radiatum]|uniref:Pentatricopeptide repeat-containing protein, chloroplastic n=1 Tax=Sesamum radiatum TaxID=300843 RepID=A0AAW2JXL0_SESRA